MLLGPALSRDGFAGAAQNTRHRGGAVWSPLSKKNREVDRPGQVQTIYRQEIWMTLRRIPVGNTRAALHVGCCVDAPNSPISTALHVSMHGTHGGAQRGRVGITQSLS